MLKFIGQFALALIAAWFLSPILEDLIPIIPDEWILEWDILYIDRILSFLRLVTWALFLLLLFLVLRPVFGFILPTARQYGSTKAMRRFQGIAAEPLLFVGCFLILSLLCANIFMLYHMLFGDPPQLLPVEDSIDLRQEFLRNLHLDRRQVAWDYFWGHPVAFFSGAFGTVWLWVLPIAGVLYAMTFLQYRGKDIRYRLAVQYEKLLRFFDQGRFGLGGAARFAGLVEEWATVFKYQPYGLFLGRSLYRPSVKIGLEDKRHMLTVAGSRTGKGTSAIIPNLLTWQGSALVIDPKGENAYWTARYRAEKLKQRVYLVDPFGVIQKDGTDAFNPLETLDPDAITYREDIKVIAEALVVRNPHAREPHWDDGAETVIAGFLDHLMTSPDYPNPTLPMLRNLLATTGEDRVNLLEGMALSTSPAGLAKDAASRILRGLQSQEIIGLLSNADKHTEWLRSPAIQQAISRSTFKFSELRDTPTTVYLILPHDYLETHNRFLRLLINLAIKQTAGAITYEPDEQAEEIPVLMILDEFLALGYMKEVEKAFALMAGYNMILWPFVQDLASLKTLYRNNVNAFITNSRAVQVFGVSDPDTTEFISQKIGDRNLPGFWSKNKANNVVRMRTPSEVEMDVAAQTDREYILRAGKPTLLLEKASYYQDPLFAGYEAYKGLEPNGPAPSRGLDPGLAAHSPA